jgi:hypothetical protein
MGMEKTQRTGAPFVRVELVKGRQRRVRVVHYEDALLSVVAPAPARAGMVYRPMMHGMATPCNTRKATSGGGLCRRR